MNCPSCRHANPPDAHFCANCGVQVVAHSGGNATIADLVNDTPSAPTIATPQPGPAAPLDTRPLDSAPLDSRSALTTVAPHGGSPGVSGQHDTTLVAGRKSSMWPIVLTVAVVAAIVIMGAVLVLSGGSNDSVTSDDFAAATDLPPPTADAAASTTPATASVPATEVPAATPTTLPSVVASTVATAAPPTTAAPETTPTTTNPAAVPPVPPEPGPINAPGSPQVLANVSPSGLAFAESATAFDTAQEFGDALALQNWDRARTLSPALADNSDEDFVIGYANTNRVSLILVDARPAGSEIELLVVSVAVELGGTQTSLYCLHWNVEVNAQTVRQVDGSRIAQWQTNAQPEAIRNDAAALATVNECVWP